MAGFILNPRRAPRLPVRLPVDIGFGSSTWLGATQDVGPGGCLLAAGRALPERIPLQLSVRGGAGDRLSVPGVVAWTRGATCGVSFGPRPGMTDPRAWFDQLVAAHPSLQELLARIHTQLPLDLRLVRAPPPSSPPRLSSDEARVVAAQRDGMPIALLALQARLPRDRFARAVFMLLERGVLLAPAAAPPPRPPGTDLQAGAAELLRQARGSAEKRGARASLHDQRIADDIALGALDR
jgi:hypothetical protein